MLRRRRLIVVTGVVFVIGSYCLLYLYYFHDLKRNHQKKALPVESEDYASSAPQSTNGQQKHTSKQNQPQQQCESIGSRPPTLQWVFSVDSSDYQRWQSRLLLNNWRRKATPEMGELWRIVSERPGRGPPELDANEIPRTLVVADYSHHDPAIAYPPFNKPYALWEWLTKTQHSVDVASLDTVIIIDPDMLIISEFTERVPPGRGKAHAYGYMAANHYRRTIKKYCLRPELYAPCGPPYVLNKNDLWALIPLWIAKLSAMNKETEKSIECRGECWVREMVAFACAAADLNITIETLPLTVEVPHMQPYATTFTIHYTYGINNENATHVWRWDKRYMPYWKPGWPQLQTGMQVPPILSHDPGLAILVEEMNEALRSLPGFSMPAVVVEPKSSETKQ